MATRAAQIEVPVPARETIPPLETGDRLSRTEFERRYTAMPGLKAELIEGIVYVASPVYRRHGRPHFRLTGWCSVYEAATPGVIGSDNTSVRPDLDNEVQPDVNLCIDASRGGQSHSSEEKYIDGSPELVGEVATSSVSYDLHAKLNVYRRNGVKEYIVWRVLDQELDWFFLNEGEFQQLPADEAGILKSRIFPGLWLDRAALLRGDMKRVLEVLQEGLQSSEHSEFVARLGG
ncbi:MAG: Uma2 family endonuclease [Planctomycetes bacterium]|nr:Uma2 family endonuclease [Planctomycetota bacterium]